MRKFCEIFFIQDTISKPKIGSILILLLTGLAVGLTGCSFRLTRPDFTQAPLTENELSVINMNAENLFDTVDDPHHNDETYLPVIEKNNSPALQAKCAADNSSGYRLHECLTTDWTEEKLQKKISNMVEVLKSADPQGPDVLMLIEVENLKVVQMLQKALGPERYITTSVIDGPDKRGINLGFLSRLPLASEPILHKIPFQAVSEKDNSYIHSSRGIFEVNVRSPQGPIITFFVAHFPSQSNPVIYRKQAAAFLAKLMKSKDPNDMVIAAGDLNITGQEEDAEKILKNEFTPIGNVSHFIGCKDCRGSHRYQRGWSFLDVQIYSQSLLANGKGAYEVIPESIDVLRYSKVHLKQGKYPLRWDFDKAVGVSDHFPIYSRLRLRK